MKTYYDGWWRDDLDPKSWPVYESFEVFLALVWRHLGLPAPTPAQIKIARYLQGDASEIDPLVGRADIILAFRGIGKSYISAAYCLWRLLRDPEDEKILVTSATGNKAKQFAKQVRLLLNTMDLLAHLRPTGDLLDQSDQFDVAGSSIAQAPSFRAVGIDGQITGGRSTLIFADDVEIPKNSITEEARERLLNIVLEFDAILQPAAFDDDGSLMKPKGDIVFLGTPQTLESMYITLVRTRGFSALCIPARYPDPAKMDAYLIRTDAGRTVNILADFIQEAMRRPDYRPWAPVDPKRFSTTDLAGREAKGRSWFALQYMLDTSLSDAERYPLKLRDLMVFSTNEDKAPATVQWGHEGDKKNVIRDLPNVGFSGDLLLRPLFMDDEWRPYQQRIIFIDPAGRGKDETSWTVLGHLNGTMYILENSGVSGDPETGMKEAAQAAQRFSVGAIWIEPNYAAGVWIAAFRPVLRRVWPEAPGPQEATWAKTQKEARIIDTLEPALGTHRLVLDYGVAQRDLRMENKEYSLLYQMSHITRDRGSLRHDDRLDSLAGAVDVMQAMLGVDKEDAWEAQQEAEKDAFLEAWTHMMLDQSGRVRVLNDPYGDVEVYSTRFL